MENNPNNTKVWDSYLEDLRGVKAVEISDEVVRQWSFPGTKEDMVREKTIEECARICEEQVKAFLSPQYAVGQPWSSFSERFAALECAREIRKLSILKPPHKQGE